MERVKISVYGWVGGQTAVFPRGRGWGYYQRMAANSNVNTDIPKEEMGRADTTGLLSISFSLGSLA